MRNSNKYSRVFILGTSRGRGAGGILPCHPTDREGVAPQQEEADQNQGEGLSQGKTFLSQDIAYVFLFENVSVYACLCV